MQIFTIKKEKPNHAWGKNVSMWKLGVKCESTFSSEIRNSEQYDWV